MPQVVFRPITRSIAGIIAESERATRLGLQEETSGLHEEVPKGRGGKGQAVKAVREGEDEMSIFKRGNVYWYHFLYDGQHVQRSTKQGNPRVARQIEAAFRTALAKGEVGITERKKAPGFKAAMRSFLAWSEQQQEAPGNFSTLPGEQRGAPEPLWGSAHRPNHAGRCGAIQSGPCDGIQDGQGQREGHTQKDRTSYHARNGEPGIGMSQSAFQPCRQVRSGRKESG